MSGDLDFVGAKLLAKCACGHQRRVHVVVRDRKNKKYEPFGEPIRYGGKCLGLSCDCMKYGR